MSGRLPAGTMGDDSGTLGTEQQDASPVAEGPDGPGAAAPAGWMPSRVSDVRRSARQAVDWAAQARRTSMPVDAGWRFVERNTVAGGLVLAGALAFRIFLFMVPYVFTLVVSLGVYAEASAASTQEAAQEAGVTGLLARAVGDVEGSSSGFRWGALIGGLVTTLWAGYGLAKTVVTVHVLAWGIPRTPVRRLWLHPVYVIAFVTGVLLASRLFKLARDALGPLGLALTLLAVALVIVAWLALTSRLPHAPGSTWFDLLPGAILVGIGVQGLHLATIYYYSRKVASLNERYGLIGEAVGLLSWAYVLGWIVTAGAMLNASLYEARRRRSSG